MRSFALRRPRPSAWPRSCRPRLGPWEDRWLPSVLSYTSPTGNGADNLELRLNGNKVELFDNGVRVVNRSLGGIDAILITGANGESDSLTVNYGFGGLIPLPV